MKFDNIKVVIQDLKNSPLVLIDDKPLRGIISFNHVYETKNSKNNGSHKIEVKYHDKADNLVKTIGFDII